MSNWRYWNHGPNNRDVSFRGHGRVKTQWRGGSNFKYPRIVRGGNRNQNFQFKNNVSSWKKARKDGPGKRLSEEDIGVTEYISDHEGFTGVIKYRYSDFQVSEINDKGEIAELTDLAAPEPPTEDIEDDEQLLLSKYNLDIMPTKMWDELNRLVMRSEQTDEVVELDATDMSKEERTKVHESVKKVFGNAIVGSTVNVDDKKYVRFTKYRKGVRIDKRVKWVWPGEYVYLVLHKENCDSMDAAARIAERLRISTKILGYAGTKDRRAKTSQWLSLRKVDPRRVATACRDMKDIYVGNYTFSDKPLKLGMLYGNRFRIAVRNVVASEALVGAACARLADAGFVNYFGLQRFGARADAPTHLVGLRALQGDFQGAIDILLGERECAIQHALQAYWRSGPASAAAALPVFATQCQIEAGLLRSLARDPHDILGAFGRIPRNARLLYLHAYQSLVWNRCASERVRRLGRAPAAGDLVPLAHVPDDLEEDLYEAECSSFSEGMDETEDVVEKQDGDAEEDSSEEQDGEANDSNSSTQNTKKKTDMTCVNTKAKEMKPKIPVKVLTQEDVESGEYTLYDIVLPLPGHGVEYPPNMKDYYEELLVADGLNLDMKHKYKAYSVRGAYRSLCARPAGVQWACARYDAPREDLLLSDIDRVRGRKLTGVVEGGKYKALLLTMSLPVCCYATVALRELMKTGTAADFQASQNRYHEHDAHTHQKADEAQQAPAVTEKKDDEIKEEGGEAQQVPNVMDQEAVETDEPESEKVGSLEGNGAEKRKIEDDGQVDIKKLKSDDK